MKNLLLFITLLFISVPAVQAQDEATYGYEQGDWVLGWWCIIWINGHEWF